MKFPIGHNNNLHGEQMESSSEVLRSMVISPTPNFKGQEGTAPAEFISDNMAESEHSGSIDIRFSEVESTDDDFKSPLSSSSYIITKEKALFAVTAVADIPIKVYRQDSSEGQSSHKRLKCSPKDLIEKLLVCNLCGDSPKRFNLRNQAITHLSSVHGKKYCPVCFELLDLIDERFFVYHMKQFHSIDVKSTNVKCIFCFKPIPYNCCYNHISTKHLNPVEQEEIQILRTLANRNHWVLTHCSTNKQSEDSFHSNTSGESRTRSHKTFAQVAEKMDSKPSLVSRCGRPRKYPMLNREEGEADEKRSKISTNSSSSTKIMTKAEDNQNDYPVVSSFPTSMNNPVDKEELRLITLTNGNNRTQKNCSTDKHSDSEDPCRTNISTGEHRKGWTKSNKTFVQVVEKIDSKPVRRRGRPLKYPILNEEKGQADARPSNFNQKGEADEKRSKASTNCSSSTKVTSNAEDYQNDWPVVSSFPLLEHLNTVEEEELRLITLTNGNNRTLKNCSTDKHSEDPGRTNTSAGEHGKGWTKSNKTFVQVVEKIDSKPVRRRGRPRKYPILNEEKGQADARSSNFNQKRETDEKRSKASTNCSSSTKVTSNAEDYQNDWPVVRSFPRLEHLNTVEEEELRLITLTNGNNRTLKNCSTDKHSEDPCRTNISTGEHRKGWTKSHKTFVQVVEKIYSKPIRSRGRPRKYPILNKEKGQADAKPTIFNQGQAVVINENEKHCQRLKTNMDSSKLKEPMDLVKSSTACFTLNFDTRKIEFASTAEQMFDTFTNCRLCTPSLALLDPMIAAGHLQNIHGMKTCPICLQLVSCFGNCLEDHMQSKGHFVNGKGFVHCPICSKPVNYLLTYLHIAKAHWIPLIQKEESIEVSSAVLQT